MAIRHSLKIQMVDSILMAVNLNDFCAEYFKIKARWEFNMEGPSSYFIKIADLPECVKIGILIQRWNSEFNTNTDIREPAKRYIELLDSLTKGDELMINYSHGLKNLIANNTMYSIRWAMRKCLL